MYYNSYPILFPDGTSNVWRLKEYEIIPFHESRNATAELKQLNDKYLDLLHKTLSSGTFYFSYTYDVSLNFQNICKLTGEGQSLIQRCDERFTSLALQIFLMLSSFSLSISFSLPIDPSSYFYFLVLS